MITADFLNKQILGRDQVCMLGLESVKYRLCLNVLRSILLTGFLKGGYFFSDAHDLILTTPDFQSLLMDVCIKFIQVERAFIEHLLLPGDLLISNGNGFLPSRKGLLKIGDFAVLHALEQAQILLLDGLVVLVELFEFIESLSHADKTRPDRFNIGRVKNDRGYHRRRGRDLFGRNLPCL